MGAHAKDASKRVAQHLLAKEIVELAHGAADAKKAETAHREAFSHGPNTFSLRALRRSFSDLRDAAALAKGAIEPLSEKEQRLIQYKKSYAAPADPRSSSTTSPSQSPSQRDLSAADVIDLPLSLLTAGSFPAVIQASGLVPSKSEARRLIQKKGVYVVVPNSGSDESPTALQWTNVPEDVAKADPHQYLIDYEALVLRVGKTKVQVCRIVKDE